MSESAFYKCACENCQGHLEFPAHAAGITTTCPHCGVETRLVAPAAPPPLAEVPPPPPPPAPIPAPAQTTERIVTTPVELPSAGGKLKRALSITGSVLLGVLVVAGIGWKVVRTVRKTGRVVEVVKPDDQPPPSKTATASTPVSAPAPKPPPTSIVLATGTPPSRKPGDDLQVTSFEVHKAKDGNLQYIVGVVTNHSASQYFNVRLEFDLSRTGGKAGDTATDIVRNLPANVGSTFKVNIIGTAPVSAARLTKLAGEKE